MKIKLLGTIGLLVVRSYVIAQHTEMKQGEEIIALVNAYSEAREKKDTIQLRKILTQDIDQLVSTGVWRRGIQEAIKGMLISSESNAGSRKLIVDKVRLLNLKTAIADCRYEIKNPDGTIRKMWSTFVAVKTEDGWKISAIRNMLPVPNP